LGGNSLTDLIVFGRAAGIHVENALKTSQLPQQEANNDDIEQAQKRLNRWNTNKDGENFIDIRVELKKIMQSDFGVFRDGAYMQKGLEKLDALHVRLQNASMNDHSQVFNTTRIEALELDNLMAVARATALSAVTRTESRGAHSREDYKDRDDINWIKHSLYFDNSQYGEMSFRPVNAKPLTVEPFLPQVRIY
jgi:succinate dehydrogenase / fumarate reductase flavoprotein subunit